jgi:hypothetical protein
MTDLSAVLRALAADEPYSRGALDVLALLGLVTISGDTATPADNVAAMAIDALRAHLADAVPAGISWGDLEGPPPRGVDILRAIEAARLARVPNPTPARVVEAAQSIIKTRIDGEDAYLMQFDTHADRYQPIGGKREPDETSLEQTLRREIAEELGLPAAPGPDLLTLTPLGHGWNELTLSATYGILTQYSFGFFHAAKLGFDLKIDQDTRWLTRGEVVAGVARDGRKISTICQQGLGLDVLDGLQFTL